MARANPFRFSTKYQDDETGLLYYGHRYYQSYVGRWMSRDSIEEAGGFNTLMFVNNTPVIAFDALGFATATVNMTRTYQGWFAVYSRVTLTTHDAEIARCCGFPRSFVAIETVGKPLVSGGTWKPRWTPENTPAGSPSGLTNLTDKAKALGVPLPPRPEGMSQDFYNRVAGNEFRMTENQSDGRNIHAGTDARYSTGCAVLGTCYVATSAIFRAEASDRFPSQITRNVPYVIPGFPASDTVQATFDFYAAIECARKRGAQIKLVTNGVPARDGNLPPPLVGPANVSLDRKGRVIPYGLPITNDGVVLFR
jgi:RHS repeat-associated protein